MYFVSSYSSPRFRSSSVSSLSAFVLDVAGLATENVRILLKVAGKTSSAGGIDLRLFSAFVLFRSHRNLILAGEGQVLKHLGDFQAPSCRLGLLRSPERPREVDEISGVLCHFDVQRIRVLVLVQVTGKMAVVVGRLDPELVGFFPVNGSNFLLLGFGKSWRKARNLPNGPPPVHIGADLEVLHVGKLQASGLSAPPLNQIRGCGRPISTFSIHRSRNIHCLGRRFPRPATETIPQPPANRERRHSRECEPEATSTEAGRSGPDDPVQLSPKAESENPRPAGAPGPANHEADHHRHPNRDDADQNVDECFHHRWLIDQLHHPHPPLHLHFL
nr:hypothetical protein Iba_chr13bCG1250 [Ipomoea batatas]